MLFGGGREPTHSRPGLETGPNKKTVTPFCGRWAAGCENANVYEKLCQSK